MSFRLLYLSILLLFIVPGRIESSKIESIRARYNLYSKDDYRAAINTENFFNPDAPITSNGTDLYEAASMALGYKNVSWIDMPSWFINTLHLDHDVLAILKKKSIYYAEINNNGTYNYILYTESGRKKAFQLLCYAFDTMEPNDKLSQDSASIDFELLTGICLGYKPEDIELYFQRSTFGKQTGNWDFKVTDQFNKFITRDWQYNGAQKFKNAQSRIDAWLENHDDITILQQTIKEKTNRQNNKATISLRYDRPFAEFVAKYSSSFFGNNIQNTSGLIRAWV